MQKERNEYLDCIKGILILAVVLGHIASRRNPDLDSNTIFLWCYSWHMFLFMAVSGYTVGMRTTPIDNMWILGRVRRLLVPYVIWTFINLLGSDDLSVSTYLITLIFTPVLWYLLVQFLMDAIYWFACKYDHSTAIIIGTGITVSLIYMCGGRCETLRNFLLYFPFYFIGLFIGKRRKLIVRKFGKIIWGSLILYPLSMFLYSWKDYEHVTGLLRSLFAFFHIPQGIANSMIEIMERGGYRVLNHYIISPLGCLFFLCITIIIFRVSVLNYIKRLFCYLGRRTIYIYILHGKFAFLMEQGALLLQLLTEMAGPCLVALISKKIPLADRVLFGGKKQSSKPVLT